MYVGICMHTHHTHTEMCLCVRVCICTAPSLSSRSATWRMTLMRRFWSASSVLYRTVRVRCLSGNTFSLPVDIPRGRVTRRSLKINKYDNVRRRFPSPAAAPSEVKRAGPVARRCTLCPQGELLSATRSLVWLSSLFGLVVWMAGSQRGRFSLFFKK